MSTGAAVGALALLGFLYLFLGILKAAFRGLSPVAAQEIIQEKGLGQDSFLRKSLIHPSPLWFSLRIASACCLIAITAILAIVATKQGTVPGWLAALQSLGGALVTALVLEFALPRLVVPGREERIIVALLGPMRALHLVLSPVSNLLAPNGNGGGGEDGEDEEADPEEIRAYIEVGEHEGILEEQEKVLIKGVVEFGDAVLREVMTPRTDVVGVEAGTRLVDLRRRMAEAMHTRLPIYRDSIDSIVGVAYIKDLVSALDEGREEEVVESIQRPALLCPEAMKVHDLLRMFQAKRISMAVVVDEYGGTSGIITMEDLIEEIVGEIQDEHETEEAWIVREADGVLSVDGRADLDEIAEVAGTSLDYDDVETVGGLLFSRMGYLPRVGEWLDLEGLRFHVLEADEKRIYRVRIERSPSGESGRETDEADGDGRQAPDRS